MRRRHPHTMIDDPCAWFGPIPSTARVGRSVTGDEKNVTVEILMMLRMNVKNKLIITNILTLKRSKLEEIQQSKRVDDDGGGCVGSGRRRRSGHRTCNEHGQDGEAGIARAGWRGRHRRW